MIKEYLVGVDIGGTKIAIILGSMDGKILKKIKFPTDNSYKDTLGKICNHINDIVRDFDNSAVKAIGISCGGPLNNQTGVILSPPNLPGWDEVPICEIISSATGINSFLENDANACALAEWIWGAGKGTENMIFLTFGTGLGAGLILNGALYEGTSGLSGEVGHIRLSENGPVGHGKAGSWEGFCSGGGLSRHYQMLFGQEKNGEEICTLANKGDEKALQVINNSAKYLGHGISILIDILNPQKVIIGSVYSRNENLFRRAMLDVIDREALSLAAADCQVVPAVLGESIGDMAALGVAINGLRKIKE